MKTVKLKSLDELIDSIEIGFDIEFYLKGDRYNISPYYNDKRFIALCPDGDAIFYDDVDSILEHKIKGVSIKDSWQEIDIISM